MISSKLCQLCDPKAEETGRPGFRRVMTHLRLSLFNALLAYNQSSIDDFNSLGALEVLILVRFKSD